MANKMPELICTNVFKNIDSEVIKVEYLKKWIALIHMQEKCNG